VALYLYCPICLHGMDRENFTPFYKNELWAEQKQNVPTTLKLNLSTTLNATDNINIAS